MKDMVQIFKDLILDFHASKLPNPIRRKITFPTLPQNVRKAFALIGMRRSGKTWTLYQIMQELIFCSIDLTKMLYINFEDERLIDMRVENFQDLIKAYFELYPQYLNSDDIYFFFDEIHEIDGWEKFIRRLLDQEKMQIYVTGSSCKMLSKEIASTLRGRTWVQEIFPFSFEQYLEKMKVKVPENFGARGKIEITPHLKNFLLIGGFPEVIGTTSDIHRQILQEYISSVVYRDIIERYNIGNAHLLRQLLTHSLKNSANIFSVNKMFNAFKSMGFEVGKNSLYEYMSYFEDAYCIFSLSKFDLSFRKSAQAMKKIYAVDQGLINAVTVSSKFDEAIQLETAVFAHFRRLGNAIYYYKTKNDKEVDFVVINQNEQLELYQVCLTLKDLDTLKREVDALETAMLELNVKMGTIVTLYEEDIISLGTRSIEVIPAYKLFLGIIKFLPV